MAETTTSQNTDDTLVSKYGTDGNPEPTSNEEQERLQTTGESALGEQTAQAVLVWRKPWQITASLFFFYVILLAYIIIQNYWIRENWDGVLPGLGDSDFRKFSIRSHMTFGVISVFCSSIQLIIPFTTGFQENKASIARNWYRAIHRYFGRVYVMCAVLAYVFGQWFICLKHFRLVGGYSMGASFSLAGFFIAYFALMTWKTAPSRVPNRNGKYPIEVHRNYALRSVSQIIAPVLYRYWYTFLMIFGLYRSPEINREDLVCDDQNVCTDYLRPFDAIYAWLYWISAWAVAEIIIACLPSHKKSTTANEIQAPLLDVESACDNGSVTNDSDGVNESNGNPDNDEDASRVSVVNYIGCIVTGLTCLVSGPILIAVVPAVLNRLGII